MWIHLRYQLASCAENPVDDELLQLRPVCLSYRTVSLFAFLCIIWLLGNQYQATGDRLPEKTRLRNDLLYVKWDV